jgi:multimeric flavodoxin WrbA
MKITILNGNPDAEDGDFEGYLTRLEQTLKSGWHEVAMLPLRDMNINYCIGCFGCWVKSPGECVSRDESKQVCQAMVQSDFTLWAAPIRMGFPTDLLKKTMDKSIPIIHPYFTVDHNEAHHQARYKAYPRFGLLLKREKDTDAEDIRIITDIFRRTALNMKSWLSLTALTDQPVDEVAQAITTSTARGKVFAERAVATTSVCIQPPTWLTVFNGSPRGRKGNTPILLGKFLEGFTSTGERSYDLYHLNHLKEMGHFKQAFAEAECVLVGFPLYTDAMPGMVKAFIETLEPFKGQENNPPFGFLVQGGLPEGVHSRYVEAYLKRLAARLGSPYLGTVVKGGCEGVREMPDQMNQKLFEALFLIGKTFGETGQFDPELLRNLAKPERYPAYLAPVFRLLVKMFDSYWDGQLKQNGVFEKRFAMPYSK